MTQISQSGISDKDLNKPQDTSKDRLPFQKRFNYLKQEGLRWYPAWQELSKYLNPTRGFFYNMLPNQGYEIDHKSVIDSHARRCIRDLASGMISGLTSPSRPWFRLGLPDKDLEQYGPAKEYLDECQIRIHSAFSKSNVYEGLHMGYEEIATFGTSATFMMEDYRDVFRFRNFTAGEYYLGLGADNRVDTFARQYWMTVGQLVKEFGLENCSPSVRLDYKNNNTERWVRICFLVEPNDKRVPDYKDFMNMPYRSIYWEDSSVSNSYLRMGGFEEFPILAPRWAVTTSADIYGRSPGWDVLGDDKMLQIMQIKKLQALDKVVDPPMQVDASVQGSVNTLPGGVTRFSGQLPNAGMKPAYQISPDINAVREDILEIKQALNDAFFRDLFKMMLEVDRGNITATEIAERQSEKLNMLSPIVEKLNNELLNPLIDRAFNIMARNGLLPEPPPELQGIDLRVQYVSVLAQAQKMIGITAIDQWTMGVMQEAQINPSSLDLINFDEKNTIKADMLGVPIKIMNSPEVIANQRKMRADQQAKIEQMQQTQMAVDMAAKGAGALKNTATSPTDTNNALTSTLAALTNNGIAKQ